MKIETVKIGNVNIISYTEDGDRKILQSEEPASPEFNESFENLALDMKIALANQLNVATALRDAFLEAHRMVATKVHFKYGEGEETPESYEVWGHHYIVDTNYDTDVHFKFKFGEENSPDKSAIAVKEAGEAYVNGDRAMGNLFKEEEK